MNEVTRHIIRQYCTFNMGKSYTFVDVQVTDEGGRDQEFPECLFGMLWYVLNGHWFDLATQLA